MEDIFYGNLREGDFIIIMADSPDILYKVKEAGRIRFVLDSINARTRRVYRNGIPGVTYKLTDDEVTMHLLRH